MKLRPAQVQAWRFARVLRASMPLAFSVGLLGGCVQTQWRTGTYSGSATLRSAEQTMDVELTDRVARLARLSSVQGMTPPHVEQITIPPASLSGAGRPVPVIRITFDERDFFDAGGQTPQPQAVQALQVVAETMRRDVPDVRLTVLGHTDASGSEQSNQALSEQRALAVVRTLVAAGVNPGQLSVVAIGKAQPIAPNDTPSGRARNRRVEFLISPSETANFAAVSRRWINPAFLSAGLAGPTSARHQVSIMRPAFAGPADFSEAPSGQRELPVSLAASGPALSLGDAVSGSPVMAGASGFAGNAALPAGISETGSPVGAALARHDNAQP